jgi:Xaa-Pro aminopeptidase
MLETRDSRLQQHPAFHPPTQVFVYYSEAAMSSAIAANRLFAQIIELSLRFGDLSGRAGKAMSQLQVRKLQRVRQIMRAAGASAMVLAENARTRYVTGYQRYFAASHLSPVHAAVVTLDDDPVLLLPPHILASADQFSGLRAMVYPPVPSERIAVLRDLLRGHDSVALELDFLSFTFADQLKSALPGSRILDAARIMRDTVVVKFPEEIALLRRAANLVDSGARAAVERIRPGATELEVAAAASQPMLEGGAEFIHHMTIRSGPHAYGLFPVPTERRFESGDCVQIDLGCMVGGYVGDINRTVIVGAPTPYQRTLFETAERMLEAAIKSTRAGVSCSEMWSAVTEEARRASMESLIKIPFVAHGIGIALQEYPVVDASATAILEKNMVLALEPGLYSPQASSRPEDMVVVTETGCEILTRFPRDVDLLGT